MRVDLGSCTTSTTLKTPVLNRVASGALQRQKLIPLGIPHGDNDKILSENEDSSPELEAQVKAAVKGLKKG